MYFGAAKDLPGVRELFEQEPPPPPRKTRGELMKDIDADYYGYRDDDDGVLIPLERLEEKKGLSSGKKNWNLVLLLVFRTALYRHLEFSFNSVACVRMPIMENYIVLKIMEYINIVSFIPQPLNQLSGNTKPKS